jgi:hypothetical protein
LNFAPDSWHYAGQANFSNQFVCPLAAFQVEQQGFFIPDPVFYCNTGCLLLHGRDAGLSNARRHPVGVLCNVEQ